MGTQTKFLRILSQKQISRNLRIFGVNFELEFYLCKKIDIMQLCEGDQPHFIAFVGHFPNLRAAIHG